MKRLAWVLLAVAGLWTRGTVAEESGGAQGVAAPELFSAGYINGRMNIAVVHRADASWDVEMKGEGEEAWSAVAGRVDDFNKNSIHCSCWSVQTNFAGAAAFRIRAVENGVASDWMDCGSHVSTLAYVGTPIGNTVGASKSSAFDGLFATWIDATGNNGDDAWVGYQFDRTVRIRTLRFLPRLDHMKLAGRYRNSLFQVASDGSFSDAQTVYTVPSGFSDVSKITEVTFDPPVAARAFRHWKAKGGYEQSAEIELIAEELPLKPALEASFSDVTNFYPVLSWRIPDERFACSTCRLERAVSSEGPWTAVTDWLDPAADTLCVTNVDGVHVGQTLHYRVAAVTQHPDYAGQVVYSETLACTRMRRLDRSWDDLSALLPGLAVMPLTNGVHVGELKNAFDGNPATFPDVYLNKAPQYVPNGPLGLDFGERAWVWGFGYVCRNDNSCYYRVQNAALYSASGDDVALRDKVQRSEKARRATQDTTFYYQEATSCPAAGARCWFLFSPNTGDFCCNVAELAFFGWTQADVDAIPVLSPPTDLAFTRAGRSIALAWAKSALAARYEVQRRSVGEAAWTTLAADVTGLSYVDEMDAACDRAAWEYRVVAWSGEASAIGEALGVYYYAPAAGTGLQGALWWPCDPASNGFEQTRNVVALGVGAVDVARPAGEELAPGVAAGARFVWDGTLVCPADGSYVFDVETDEDALVRVGGVTAVNGSFSNAVTLAAGEHALHVEYRTTKTAGTRRCRLFWSGPMAREPVPASQLVPAAETPQPEVDGWKIYAFGQNLLNAVERTAPGVYRLVSGTRAFNGARTGADYLFLCRDWRGSFDVSAQFATGYVSAEGILVRDAEGHMYWVRLRHDGSACLHVSVWGVRRGESEKRVVAAETFTGLAGHAPLQLRLVRDGSAFTAAFRAKTADAWTEIATWTDASFPRAVAVGFAACGDGRAEPVDVDVSEISLRLTRDPLFLLVR